MTKNDEENLRAEIVRALPALWRFALALCHSVDVADDLTQKTCLRALERAHHVYDLTGTQRWLLTICRSIWYNELRYNALRQSQSLESADAQEILVENKTGESNILAQDVFTTVMTLPEAQRSVVVLVLIEGYSYREAADMLSIPIGTVMSRLSAARAKLKTTLQDTPFEKRKEQK